MPRDRYEVDDELCEVCRHPFFQYHAEKDRLKGTPEEERRKRCRDCRKCQDADNNDFDAIVKGIKNPNHTAPDREPVPV